MWLKNLSFQNFRNLEDGTVKLDPHINWFHGFNGEGKTNTLEAAYYALTGKSFRGPRNSEICGKQGSFFSVDTLLARGAVDVSFRVRYESGKNQRFLGEKSCSVKQFIQHGAIVDFSERSKKIVDGDPGERRNLLDRVNCYFDGHYLNLIGQYRKVLQQMRKALRDQCDLRMFQVFKRSASPLAEKIVHRRKEILRELGGLIGEIFSEIFDHRFHVNLQYQQKNMDDGKKYNEQFLQITQRELIFKRLLVGPHLDDFSIQIGDDCAKNFASSGQVRGIVLSFLLAFREYYRHRFEQYPILLLDDVDSELDPSRVKRLMAFLEGRGQTLVSSSGCDIMALPYKLHGFCLNAGRIQLERES